MSDHSARLGLPYLAAAQAQKHVTHNEGLRRLDAYVHLTLESRWTLAPPSRPHEGGSWFVPVGAGGVFTGHVGEIASWEEGAFEFLPVPAGCLAFIRDEGRVMLFDGMGWVSHLASTAHHAAIEAHVVEEDVVLSGAYIETGIVIPDRAIVLGVSTRTLSVVTGAASYDCGVANERAKFGGSLGAARGASNAGVVGPTAYYAPTKIRLSANGGAFTGGRVRVAIHYMMCPVAAVFPEEEAWWRQAPYLLDGMAPVISADLVRERYMLADAHCSAMDMFTRSGGTKWVVNASGSLVEVPANTLAFDYSTGRRRMVLEGAATNLLLHSQAFVANWGVTRCTRVGGVADPAGGSNVSTFTTSDATGSAYFEQTGVTVTAGDVCMLSAFVKEGASPGFYFDGLEIPADASGVVTHRLSLTWIGGTPVPSGSIALQSHGVTSVGGGWHRIWMTVAITKAGRIFFRPQFSTNVLGNSLSIYLPQLEKGDVATSPIPTTTAAVTRVADTAPLSASAAAKVGVPGPCTIGVRGSISPVSGSVFMSMDTSALIRRPSGGTSLLAITPVNQGAAFGGLNIGAENFGYVLGWNAAGALASGNGALPFAESTPPAGSFSAVQLGSNTGVTAGCIIALDELLVWPFKGSTAAVQMQARIWA